MQTVRPLKELSVLELNTMLKHIRLGQEHLKKYLKGKQFNELLDLATLDEKQKKRISSDNQEKAGNIAVVLNAVITGTLGAWLGMSGYLGFKLGSIPVLISILIFCALVSGWIGYVSYKVTSKKAKDMRVTKKLRLIELQIIRIINEQRHKDIESTANMIVHKLTQIDSSLKEDKAKQAELLELLAYKEDFAAWLHELETIVNKCFSTQADSKLHKLVQKKINKILGAVKKLTDKLCSQQVALKPEGAEEPDYSFGTYTMGRSFSNASYVKILTTPGLDKDMSIQKPHKWLKSNTLAVLTGLVPTIAGSFGSMFVFLAGTPQVMQSLGQNAVAHFLFQDHMRVIGITIAIALTLYYGYSNVYTNYKNFLRQKEVEKTEKLIAEENAKLLKIGSKYNLLTRIRTYVEELRFIHNMLENLVP